MNTHGYVEAAWRYWGVNAGPTKPKAEDLTDEVLFAVQKQKLPMQAYEEVLTEWERRKALKER